MPFSVFGTQRAAVYIGHRYLVFNAIEHIRLFSQRFDEIIKTAVVLPHAVGDHIEKLLLQIDRPPGRGMPRAMSARRIEASSERAFNDTLPKLIGAGPLLARNLAGSPLSLWERQAATGNIRRRAGLGLGMFR